jgi:hypothetical protein
MALMPLSNQISRAYRQYLLNFMFFEALLIVPFNSYPECVCRFLTSVFPGTLTRSVSSVSPMTDRSNSTIQFLYGRLELFDSLAKSGHSQNYS